MAKMNSRLYQAIVKGYDSIENFYLNNVFTFEEVAEWVYRGVIPELGIRKTLSRLLGVNINILFQDAKE